MKCLNNCAVWDTCLRRELKLPMRMDMEVGRCKYFHTQAELKEGTQCDHETRR